MATYHSFEELPSWNAAVDLAVWVYDFTEDAAGRFSPSFRDQLERAAQSVSNNIAEGFERSANAELNYFLSIAKGSCGEVRSMLRLATRRARWKDLRDQMQPGIEQAESIGRQLGAWMEHLRNSPMRGARHTTRVEHAERQNQASWESREREVMEQCPEGHPLKRLLGERLERREERRRRGLE